MLDANFQGLVRQSALGTSIDELREIWAEHELRIRDIDPQEASDLLANGLQWYDDFIDPPVYDDVPPMVNLLRARLRALPPARPIERPEVPAAERRRIARSFARSKDAVAGADNELLAAWFIDFAVDYGAGDPLRWSPIAVETCLLDFFARKVIIDAETAPQVPDALRGFVRFAAARKKLSAAAVAETLDTVHRFEADFLAAMGDEATAGPGKLLAQAALREGVDFGDPTAVQRWVDDFNSRPFEERDRVLAPALGARQGASDDAAARRAFAFPPLHTTVDGISTDDLDPADQDERELLVMAEHPEFARALKTGADVQVGGQTVNPRLHVVVHVVVANQLWENDPPEAWEAARRLSQRGVERHDVLHRLAGVVSEDIYDRLHVGGRRRGKQFRPADAEAMNWKLRAAYLALADESGPGAALPAAPVLHVVRSGADATPRRRGGRLP